MFSGRTYTFEPVPEKVMARRGDVEAKLDEQNINLNHNEIPNNRFKIMLFSMFSSKI